MAHPVSDLFTLATNGYPLVLLRLPYWRTLRDERVSVILRENPYQRLSLRHTLRLSLRYTLVLLRLPYWIYPRDERVSVILRERIPIKDYL